MALAKTGGGGGGPASAPASKPFWERAKTSNPPPAVAARPLPQSQPQYQPQYRPAPPAALRPVPAPLVYGLEQGPPRAPDLDYIYWRRAAEELRREWEHRQGDSIRIPLPGEPRAEGWQPLGRIPELESDEAAPMPRQMQPSFPTSPLMSIPLVNQIAPFVLALVETAAQAQPGTFDAARPEGTLEAALQNTWGGLSNEGASAFVEADSTPSQRAKSQVPAEQSSEEERLARIRSMRARGIPIALPGAAPATPRNTTPRYYVEGAGERQTTNPFGVRAGFLPTDAPAVLVDGEEVGQAGASRRFAITRPDPRVGWTGANDAADSAMDAWGARLSGQARAYESQQRVAALRVGRDAEDRKERVQEMTLEQWNALSPRQQAIVQVNYDLDTALTRDRENDVVPTGDQRRAYDERVREMFGPQRVVGTDEVTYAPETVAVLSRLDLSPEQLEGFDLDDFLRFDTAASRWTVNNLDREPRVVEVDPAVASGPRAPLATSGDTQYVGPRDQRLALAQTLADAQLQLQSREVQETVARGQRLLTTMTAESANEVAQTFGAQPMETAVDRLGKLDQTSAALVERYLQALAIRSPGAPDQETPEFRLGLITEDMDLEQLSDRQRQTIWRGVQDRIDQSVRGDMPWFPEEIELGGSLFTPQQVADMIGQPALRRGAA